MWAAGCVLYTILCGYQPFFKQYVAELIEAIRLGAFEFDSEVWAYISPEAKQLITRLLDLDPSKRPSPADAMAHPWFSEYRPPNTEESRDSRLIIQSNLRANKRRLTRCLEEEDFAEFMPKRLSFNKALKIPVFDEHDSSMNSSDNSLSP
jgi:serine/threonine protein kinase